MNPNHPAHPTPASLVSHHECLLQVLFELMRIEPDIVFCQNGLLHTWYVDLLECLFWVSCDCSDHSQVVVPSSYRPKSGALFKARALQYCLEEDVNVLADTDWIVHLDEETLATEAAIRGILNFVIEGRHQFGQVSGCFDLNSAQSCWDL